MIIIYIIGLIIAFILLFKSKPKTSFQKHTFKNDLIFLLVFSLLSWITLIIHGYYLIKYNFLTWKTKKKNSK